MPTSPPSARPSRILTPFADDAASSAIGSLTIENGRDRVALYGSLDLTRDRQGLAQAQALKAVLDAVVEHLSADPALPEALPAATPARSVPNPFA